YYNSREFTPGESTSESPSKIMIKNLKERLLPSPAAGLLPWWQRGKIRPNPNNAEGTLCDKPD
ncbi:hypothetical protein CMI37_32745, partial [Candidatus Pacearchaeota archaeon]|nr:hypothetical protein [Candidatus Pacearchaeota archaeon]